MSTDLRMKGGVVCGKFIQMNTMGNGQRSRKTLALIDRIKSVDTGYVDVNVVLKNTCAQLVCTMGHRNPVGIAQGQNHTIKLGSGNCCIRKFTRLRAVHLQHSGFADANAELKNLYHNIAWWMAQVSRAAATLERAHARGTQLMV